ncbi:MAG: ABC transporter related protein [Methanomicrobiales archaeon 53_19]|uniref:ABC transporter ATP-binding protein n=1 Tax=Methanocalculus sp. TaxID=2004547 RepID=UPI00074667A3|nr:ABC transporter ATP-binding protein [Methanocalculus sp.]KUL04678.1 MAG: ABC transporter related protein [Methanomicrobiales archaeon 53_19]HIJ06898.1 ABC transporter ATP-binding protein [Methanocalculus sp.]
MTVVLRNVSKTFTARQNEPLTALQDISAEVSNGEFLCILGPSGCGKTTLLRMIGGLDHPTSGEIEVEGTPVTGPDPRLAMIFQEYSLYPWRTVRANVGFGLQMRGMPHEEREEIVTRFIGLVGLEGFGDSYPYELSGGMRQRVAVARALATDPAVLLMDEPFGALDAQTRNRMQKELLLIWEKTKKTVIFVTHSVDEAVYLADRIMVLSPRPGRIAGIYDVDIPRPRDRTSIEFAGLRRDVLELIDRLEDGQ